MRPTTVIWWSGGGERNGSPDPDRVTPVVSRSAAFNKPNGGFWTSPEVTDYGWEDWCRDNEMDWLGRRWRLHVTGAPRVLYIDSAADLEAAFRRYPQVDERLGYRDAGIDWEAVGADYDAVWLTARGHFETRLAHVSAMSMGTYAWDCDTVLWYRWSFGLVEPADRVESEVS